MKGPGIKDYLAEIQKRKEAAIEQGEQYLELSSKALHGDISPLHATMPTCCQAIYKEMLEGDEIIKRPKGTTGFGSHLSVRFNLVDLASRPRLFPDKKRGRPAKSEEEKVASKKGKVKRNTNDLIELISGWLINNDWDVDSERDFIQARKNDEVWVINVNGMKRGRKQTLGMKLSEIIKNIQDTNVHYSMAFNDSISYRRQWSEIPNAVKLGLNMSLLLADKKGNISKI